ncbi:MAG: CCA tRNA nucleotidyltransferase [Sphaerochaetaceae bacterium]|jgi:tRNA nucleotidyltransferase (CCA-adding enzyme)
MKKFPLTKQIKEFTSIFKENGFSIYIVGGAVRDYLLSHDNGDYDFATDALPKDVKKLFRTVIPTGIKHGTVTVVYKKVHYEVTTFRSDGTYLDHRRPKDVKFISSLKEDLSRRDFTINALAVDPSNGEIIDYHGGLGDLKNKVIKAIGEREKRFEEDALRIMRGCRFASQLNFTIEDQSLLAMAHHVKNLKNVSNERIRDEIVRIIKTDRPSVGFLALKSCNALDVILPELNATVDFEQKGYHLLNLFEHSLVACDAVDKTYPLVRLAALLHDLGKITTKNIGPEGEVTFYNHDKESTKIAKNILGRLKFSNEEISTVLNLVNNHMFNYESSWTDGAVRRFINRVGLKNIDDLFILRRADRFAINGSTNFSDLVEFKKRIENVLEKSNALSLKDLSINGEQLAKLGIPRGPKMGLILNYLLEAVLDDPSQNTYESLKTIAINYYNQSLLPTQFSTKLS